MNNEPKHNQDELNKQLKEESYVMLTMILGGCLRLSTARAAASVFKEWGRTPEECSNFLKDFGAGAFQTCNEGVMDITRKTISWVKSKIPNGHEQKLATCNEPEDCAKWLSEFTSASEFDEVGYRAARAWLLAHKEDVLNVVNGFEPRIPEEVSAEEQFQRLKQHGFDRDETDANIELAKSKLSAYHQKNDENKNE